MTIKEWVYGQVVAQPDLEFNRIESNLEEATIMSSWIDWPVMSFKKDWVVSDVISKLDLQQIEDNCETIATELEIAYSGRVWENNTIITHEDFNRWEQFVVNAVAYIRSLQYPYCGTFRAGEAGMI